MNIDQLPDHILVQIFRYLPLKQEIGFESINKHFQNVSKLALSEIKELDFQSHLTCDFPTSALQKILELCWKRLEIFRFPLHDLDDGPDFLGVFSQFTCPKLVHLELHCALDIETFCQLMRNNLNLKNLTCDLRSRNVHSVVFPSDVIHQKLESLTIRHCDQNSLMSFIGRVPNLKKLDIITSGNFEQNVLDEFFGDCQLIEALEIHADWAGLSQLEQVPAFWQLPLNLLSMDLSYHDRNVPVNDPSGDRMAAKIVSSFRNLKILKLALELSNDGVTALSGLGNLEEVSLRTCIRSGIDQGLRQFTQCDHLQKLSIDADIEPMTLIALVNGCHDLQYLAIMRIREINTAQMAAEIAQSFNGYGSNLIVEIFDRKVECTWQLHEVNEILKRLKDNENREIIVKEHYYH